MSKHMLITAGPTHEPIDRVRYLANRSSGKMGVAVARVAREVGWSVTLLLGPVESEAPAGVAAHRFETCTQLRRLLLDHFDRCDVLVMAAAVADYRPIIAADCKLPRTAGNVTIELQPTPDLVAECCRRKRRNQLVVGFALEEDDTGNEWARQKLARKGLDAIVANPLETMGSDRTLAKVITASGDVAVPAGWEPVEKPAFARLLVDWIERNLRECP